MMITARDVHFLAVDVACPLSSWPTPPSPSASTSPSYPCCCCCCSSRCGMSVDCVFGVFVLLLIAAALHCFALPALLVRLLLPDALPLLERLERARQRLVPPRHQQDVIDVDDAALGVLSEQLHVAADCLCVARNQVAHTAQQLHKKQGNRSGIRDTLWACE